MTDREIAALIINRWRIEHDPQAIMLACICMGRPLRKAQVLQVIRAWIDCETENKTYRASPPGSFSRTSR